MFSETRDLLDEADLVIDSVSGYVRLSSQSMVSLEKRLILSLIASKGDEERRGYSGPVRDALSLIALGVGVYMEQYLYCKVEYVKQLFSLLPFQCWRFFYRDLRLGLDNVIRLWDDSAESAYLHFFTKPPTGYVRRVILYGTKQ